MGCLEERDASGSRGRRHSIEEELPGMVSEAKNAEDEIMRDQLINYAADIAELYRNLKRENEKLVEANRELEESCYETILMGFDLITLNDEFLGGHCKRVSYYAESLAKWLGMDERIVSNAKLAALLHDAGLMGIPVDKVRGMFSDGPLSKLEIYRKHPLFNLRPITSGSRFRHIAAIMRSHHENMDGSGFPYGLIGERIPVESRIIAIADGYDRYRCVRSKPVDSREIVEAMAACGRGRYDKKILQVFAHMIAECDPFQGMKKILLQDLVPGMVLARTIDFGNGIRLLSRDTIIRRDHIAHLRKYFRFRNMDFSVYVYLQKGCSTSVCAN
jgi:HD-GYP domain-containing protein (c-di-GMP phosphodiesterase class II)